MMKKVNKYARLIIGVIIFCFFSEVVANYAFENRIVIFSGVVSPNDAPYRCIFPWHIGRKLDGFDISDHDSFTCEWHVIWVDWRVNNIK